jgi:hypothetical protein
MVRVLYNVSGDRFNNGDLEIGYRKAEINQKRTDYKGLENYYWLIGMPQHRDL